MNIITSDLIDFVNDHNKTYMIDSVTFEYSGPTEEEKLWTPVDADGPTADIFRLAEWLKKCNITEWWWRDREPERMVHRYTLYFKHEKEATMFRIWFS